MAASSQQKLPPSPASDLLSQARHNAQTWADFSKKLEASIVQGGTALDPFLIEHALAAAEKNGGISPPLDTAIVSKVKTWISQQRVANEQSFEARLRAFSESNHITVDGRFPSYLVGGFLRLQLNTAKGECDIGDKRLDTILFDSVSAAIGAAIKEEAQRPFERGKFMGDLYHAYTRAAALGKLPSASAVPVKDVFLELIIVKQNPKFLKAPSKSNFQEYPKEFFLRDLAKLVASGSLTTPSGKRLVLAPTAFSADAFPILEGSAVRYVGKIAFTDSEQH